MASVIANTNRSISNVNLVDNETCALKLAALVLNYMNS